MRAWLMRLFGVRDRYQEGFIRGRYYALSIFSDAMMDAKVPIHTQIDIHRYMVKADESAHVAGEIDLA